MAQATCAHEGCTCLVEDTYCSPHCEEHADHTSQDFGEHACDCGHPECEGARTPTA